MNAKTVNIAKLFKSPVLAGLFLLVLVLSGCQHPNTPDSATNLFWLAILADDLQSARNLATRDSETLINPVEPSWKKADVQLGEIRINDNVASVQTTIVPQSTQPFTLLTYLIKEDGEWKIDYKRTRYSLPGAIFEGLFKSLNKIGETFAKELEKELPMIEKEFKTFGEQLKKQLEQLDRELEKLIPPKNKDPYKDTI